MNLKKIALLGGVGMASAAVGVAIPQVMNGHSQTNSEVTNADAGHEDTSVHEKQKSGHEKKEKKAASKADDHGKSASHGSGGHGKDESVEKVPVDGPCFIPFGRLVVNLNEPTLTKYLSIEITMQADGEHQEEVTEAFEARKPILNTWLTTHLADKTIDDVRGKVGINRLRREIQDNFNSLLFTDGRERIQDILFEEFHVQ